MRSWILASSLPAGSPDAEGVGDEAVLPEAAFFRPIIGFIWTIMRKIMSTTLDAISDQIRTNQLEQAD